MTGRYDQPAALRNALEIRLKRYSRDRGLPLDRVRKEAAFQRLLARIAAVAPVDSWALKGGQAMIARSSRRARATADADATWRTDANQVHAVLTTAVGLDLGDHFQFLLAPPANMRGEGPEGAIRFPIQARLAGRMFEPLHLDLNLVPGDTRPVEKLALHNLFDFADLPAVIVPAVSPAQQLAEKLHAYTRDYGTHENSRVKDLYDMLLIAADLTLPPLRDLTGACTETFALRSTAWPPRLAPPPNAWAGPWAGFVRDYGITFPSLEEAYDALTAFWQPVIDHTAGGDGTWDAPSWTWISGDRS